MEPADLSVARNFVFTHLFGPLLSQSISIFLYITDPDPGFACWTIIVCIWAFWALPFVLKYTRSLQVAALISVELLAFTSLFGTYHYGGVSSPFLPWLIISLLLGFFYLSDRPVLVVGLFIANISGLLCAYLITGFPEIVPLSQLTTVGWISISSATIYMSWMAIYYANIMSMRSELERETERHRLTAERLREAKELADAANRAKSIFLAKMSHEFRTPLNAIIGYSEILLEEIEPDARGKAKQADLQRISSAGRHLLSLVTDVLDLSKIESNAVDLTIETFGLNDFVEQVVATAQPLISANGNQFVVQHAGQLGTISTDQTKLRQITLNLLSNAGKFTRDGKVELSIRHDRRAGGDWIEIQVRDTGIGMAPEGLAKLFQNFGQVSAATSGKYGGTGLGLALSQKLSNLLGGSIVAASEVGRGSLFTVRIPSTPGPVEAPDGPQGPAAAVPVPQPA